MIVCTSLSAFIFTREDDSCSSDVENRKDVGNIYEATYVASEITIACQIVFVKYLRAEFRITKN